MHATAEVKQIIKADGVVLATSAFDHNDEPYLDRAVTEGLDRALARALAQSDGMVLHDFFKAIGLNHSAHQVLCPTHN